MTDAPALSPSPSTSANNVSTPTHATASLNADLGNINGLTTYVNTIFQQMEEKFMATSDQMMNRMNDLGKKIDSLETNLGDIISHLPTEDVATQVHAANQPVK